ncbi:helix-turn-helix transcriptional regulator [Croceiramulus getboli]|nr:helix-turn-helix domain-containing protein [Flavobacteriaceae bacterium YJPT1-3]
MVNSEKFADRLQKIMEEYDLTAAAFADALDVGRATISHISSGRNKPSLDFVMKVVETYPEVNLYWLLNGKGSFPSSTEAPPSSKPRPDRDPTREQSLHVEAEAHSSMNPTTPSEGKTIEKIVIFYTDGSFSAYQ